MDNAHAQIDTEGAGEVNVGTQKIVEEDLCGFAPVLMMPFDQTVMYTTNRPRATGGKDFSGPGDQRICPALRPQRLSPGPICPRGGGAVSPKPKQVPCHCHAPKQPDGGARRRGGWDGSGGGQRGPPFHPNPAMGRGRQPWVVDTPVLVKSELLVADPERPKEYWCPC